MTTWNPKSVPRINRRGRYVLGGLVAVIALLTVGGWLTGLYTSYLWYDSVGYTGVFSTLVWTRVLMFSVFGVALALWTAANLWVAYRFRPDAVPHTPEQQSMERYRNAIAAKVGWVIGGLGALVGVFAGISAQGRWQEWLLFFNSQKFGVTDPEFDVDAGFYVFELPFWRYLVGVGFTMVVIGIIAALGAHYLYGAVRLSGRGERVTPAARWHLSILVGLFVLLKAVAYYLDRYGLTLEDSASVGVTGGGYTEMTALLPAKNILILVSVLAAITVVVFSNYYARSLVIPGTALGLVLVSAIALGGVYPYFVNEFSVTPNVPAKEGEYVSRTIEGTRYAYGMADLKTEPYKATGNADPNQMNDDPGTVDSTRVMDPAIISDSFTQKQRAKGFQAFNEKLDVDVYDNPGDDGGFQDYVTGVREYDPDKLTDKQKDNWAVRHTVYTHGYGLVTAPSNKVCGNGPEFTSGSLLNPEDAAAEDDQDCRATAKEEEEIFGVKQPRVYFGELNDDYAIVGAPKGSKALEYDRPAGGTTTDENTETDDKEQKGDDNSIYVTYDGKGGVAMNSFWRKAAYAWDMGEIKFVTSDVFNDNSRLLYDRTPRERVQKVAPFLTVDGDPYPTVVDGKIKWVLDAYTTSDSFPYSQRLNLQDATTDSYTGEGASRQSNKDVNYMRNSVKATVDAYSGEVELYEFGEKDPLLKVWDAAFGDIVKSESKMPDDLRKHLRYPVDQFKVQQELLQRYHVTDPTDFINGNQAWETPKDPTGTDDKLPPYFVKAQYPDQKSPQFQLTSTFSPQSSENVLQALVSGRYDEKQRPVLTIYEVGGSDIESTRQIHQSITQDERVAERLKNYEQANSNVQWGNLLSLPVGDGVMYVEPMYLQKQASGSGVALPELQNVAVSYGGEIGFAKTFEGAVEDVIAQYTGDTDAGDDDAGDDKPDDEGGTGEVPKDVQEALDAIDEALADLDKAMKDGDLTAQGKALEKLDKAMEQYDKAKKG
ncbi:UPF0182 family protein [Stackebrandtia nassauensis]|uniref:Uncharacterized protein n=1 Tax=Stackebrandtia nassauensis (strain DSM 44728 / CIP 108903 / NRRL B-16338 / NBRC 102104 / LLR-40K-21) TaxID=446470 RepID=D3Q3V7_STANL|nr:UPF0182 family protein [Stackebrandtia nassauensis]ADD44024.1 protein of unknown function UPF0182 [Stackebrandtia nassauensis DSM 44728]